MTKLKTLFCCSFLFSSVSILSSQTDLYWGDVLVFSMAADMGGACGLTPGSDQISFVFMEDVETGTTFEMTDNGWETIHANRWDDLEGTISITRTGGTVPRGTMITLQAINIGGTFSYKFVSPDNNWTITDVNTPGGQFNLESGDQVYWLTGGTWDNNGGFSRRATYSGRTIFGANLSDTWAANGTLTQSNLHPEVLPCYYMTPSFGNGPQPYVKYSGPMDGAGYIGWQERMAPQYFSNWPTCNHYLSNGLDFTYGPNVEFIEDMGIWCPLCLSCLDWETPLIFTLPADGLYDIAYTDGVDTFYLNDLEHGDFIYTLVDTTQLSFQLVWVKRAGTDCKVYSHFHSEATISVNSHDPGEYAVIEICSTYQGALELFYYLEGTPEPGGTWSPPLAFNKYWYAQFGEGLFTYVFKNNGPPNCPLDSASVRIRFIDLSDTEVSVECDVNGTPNDIFDDLMVVTLLVHGDTTYPFYYAEVDEGIVTPLNGIMEQPSTFYLSPGTAVGDGVNLTIHAFTPFDCYWNFFIEPTGFCSDPCKYDMISSITGPEDICIRNCPDNPETFTINIEGGTPPYKMDLTLEAPNQPAWHFNGIPAGEENEIQVCVDNVIAPIFNQAALTLTLPQYLANSSITFTLEEVYDFYDCNGDEDPFDFTLNVHALPPITTTIIKLCSEEKDHFNLTDYDHLISNFLDVSWYDGNPLQGGDLIYSPTNVDFDNIVSLWAGVKDDYCENSIAVPFQIFPTPDLDTVPDQEICPGTAVVLADIPLVDQGNSMATYTYHLALPPLSANMVDSLFFIPPDTTTVYVHATAGFCFDTIPIIINVQDFPTFLLEGNPCDLGGGTYSVLITNNGDSLSTTHGTVTNNPSGQDIISGIPNDTNITVSIFNASGLCLTAVDIVAPNCNCPQINQPEPAQSIYAVCEGQALPLLTVSIDGGLQADWYTVPSGGLPFLTNSLSYQPVNAVNTTFYVEALEAGSGCYSIRTPVTLQIDPVAQIQLQDDPIGCAGFSIDFSTFIPAVLNGVDGTGQWFALPGNVPVSGNVIPANGNTYYYQFVSATGACESSDTITVVANPLPTIDVYNIVCDEMTLTYDLLFTSDATGITASTGALNQVPGTDSFALTGIAFNVNVNFNLQNNITGCAADIAQAAPDCSCPPLLDANSTQLCSSSGVLDLDDFVGPGVNGSWQVVTTPPGSNPAALMGSNFDGQNADEGPYQLRFVRAVIIDECIDTAFFDLQLVNAPTADAGVDATSCAPDVIQLSGSVTGSGAIFSWSENGSATISNPNALNTSYTPTQSDFGNGSVSFTLTATDPTGTCPAATESITIAIDASAYYTLDNSTLTYCDTSDIQIDLDALITFGVTSGTWFFPDTVSAPLNGSVFNPSTLPAGNYTVFYTSTTAVAPCQDDTTAVPLIIQSCACPSVALSIPSEGVCSENSAVDLNNFLITSESGSWSIQSAPPGVSPAVINGSQFVTSNSNAGTYIIRFTLTNPVAGCDVFADIILQVIASPRITLISIDCTEDLQSWTAVIESSSTVFTTSHGVVTALGGNRYQIDQLPLEIALQFTATTGSGFCIETLDVPAPDCACTISINGLPDAVVLCPEDAITFNPTIADGIGMLTSYWIVNGDTVFQHILQISLPGSYTFIATDETGCHTQHNIDVIFYTEMAPDISAQDIQCANEPDGVIFLNAIVGGNAPYFIAVNGGTAQQINSFPFSIQNLAAGDYQVVLMDGFSCSVTINLTITDGTSAETLTLGPDLIITNGDSVIIDPQLSFTPASFTWSGDLTGITPTALYNVIRPTDEQVMILTALDANGCAYSDTLRIRVKLESSILVPNVFTPNGDGINDSVFPTADGSITSIEYWDVYDNWGELVHSAKNFAPNDPGVGWDGTFRGKKMRTAVFTWRMAAINSNGATLFKYGNITLVR